MVQWIRLHTPNAGGPGMIPDQGTRYHKPRGAAKTKKNKKTKETRRHEHQYLEYLTRNLKQPSQKCFNEQL